MTRARKGRNASWPWFLALALGSAGCGDSAPNAPDGGTDTAVACERGEVACACTTSGGCRDGLFCIARRCLEAEDEGPMEPNIVRPPLRPINPVLQDASVPAPAEDAAPAAVDAAAPLIDGSTSPPDASQSPDASADAG